MKYFLKNRINNKSFNFDKINTENYIRRTNNICESFHRTLNSKINHFHPKISYLVNKLGFFAIETFKKYNASMVGINNEVIQSSNISTDIYNFIRTFHLKYNKNFEIDNLLENLEVEKNNIYEICKQFLELIFIDGEVYLKEIEKENEDQEDNEENDINDESKIEVYDDCFLTEKDDLIKKLNNLELNNIEEKNQENMLFEEEEEINGNNNKYIKLPNGKRKLNKITNNFIEKLYTLKKNK